MPSKDILKYTLILLPFLMILISEILIFNMPAISTIIKVAAVLYMFLFALIYQRFSITFLFLLAIFIPFFVYGILHSFSLKASISEGFRYLFPIAVLFFGYSIRKNFKFLFYAFLIFVVINNLWQIINYINWLRGETQWFYSTDLYGNSYYNASSGIIRATGIVGFFGLHGFINLIAFFLAKKYYFGKRKNLVLTFFVVSLFLSFSYKTIGTFFVLLFVEFKNKLRFFQVVGTLLVITFMIIPNVVVSMGESIVLRIREYITEGYSARAESYRVMFAEIGDFNLFGRGIGSFGGPASVTYNSPVYSEYRFDWFDFPDLPTTDTYFPHLFVEMGIVGGLLYLLIIFAPIALSWSRDKFKLLAFIYFALFFDALFSYSLNNIAFLMFSIIFLYPLYYYREDETSTNITILKGTGYK